MPTLRELQAAFACAVLDGRDGELDAHVVAGALPPARRIQVYRNNTRENLAQALRADYPVVVRLVGEDFFDYLAREYQRVHPSRRGDLGNYGSHLPEFIESFAPARDLPYLADVARLELAWQAAGRGADFPRYDASELAALPAAHHEDLRARIHPAACLLQSRWPVLRIVEVNREGWQGDSRVRLDEGGVRILVHRGEDGVRARALDGAEHELIAALARGAPLGTAAGAALARDPDFDLAATLARLVDDRVVIDLFL